VTARNAVSSTRSSDRADRADHTAPIFPEGHALRRLVSPTFDTIRRSLAGMFVATIWLDGDADPKRQGFRPSYDGQYGPGSSSMMPFVAAWLSTGPGSEADGNAGNVVLFLEGMDPTLIPWAERAGVLGPYEWVSGVPAMKARVQGSGKRVYNIDDLGADFDASSRVSSELSLWLNSKEHLASITAFGPREVLKDMYDVSPADFAAAARGGGRVFLKTCNTESAGTGVYIARTLEEFEAHLATIRNKQQAFDLRRSLVIQPEIRGRNQSFQVMLDPRRRDEIQVVAVTDQLVEADGKTYRSSINHPITRETVEPVGAAILDMVDRIWARHPDAFGFLMSDFFMTDEGPVIYDPGIRPTGNTATALAGHLARARTGRFFMTSLIPLPTGVAGLTFERFARTAGRLVELENLEREGRAVVPWGWNAIQGFGMVIGLAESAEALEALRADVLALRYE
jgi:hypothetical protein